MVNVTVIIPNYNGLHFLKPCLDALEKQSCRDFEVLLVDNGSSDGSREYIESLGSAVKSILLSENTGFTGAVNAGIKASGSKYTVLLNNDTEVFPEYLEEMVRVMEEDKSGRLFAVSPQMIQLHHPELLDDAGDGYCLAGWAFQRGTGQPVTTPKYSRPAYVFSACAGAALYRTELLREIALSDGSVFDPAHFAYLEDVDVSFRAAIHGYRVLYLPSSKVLHVGSGTSGSKYNAFKVRLAARNNVWLNVKNMPLLMLIVNLPFLLIGVLIKQCFFAAKGFGKEYFRGFLEGLGGINRLELCPFRMKNLGNYLRIEWMMLLDCFAYLGDFLARRLKRP